jgi:hypothetical protein
MRDLRILITGSRNWTDGDVIRGALLRAIRSTNSRDQDVTVVHGGARGADTIAADIARRLGCQLERHPAQWQDGPAAGPRRNRHMVALGADVCLAFPLGESPGTRGCVELAHAAGIPVTEYSPKETL